MNNVKIRNKNDMTETELIIHILTSLPEEYEVAVSDLENKLMHPTEDLNIEEVREKIVLRHERLTDHEKDVEQEMEDKAFAAFKKQFKGNCTACGRYGHKKGDPKCPETQRESNRRTNNRQRHNNAKSDNGPQ